MADKIRSIFMTDPIGQMMISALIWLVFNSNCFAVEEEPWIGISIGHATTVPEYIKGLGHPYYVFREACEEKLIKLGQEVIKDVQAELEITDDAEVRMRLRRIIRVYLQEITELDCPIWSLPKKYRYVEKEDIAIYYYKEALKDDQGQTFYFGHNNEMAKEALRMYAMNWLREGRPKKELLEVIEQVKTNWLEERLRTSGSGDSLNQSPGYPVPIEERLKDLMKKPEPEKNKEENPECQNYQQLVPPIQQ